MTGPRIVSVYETPRNEGTADFKLGSATYRYPWTVGRIEVESRRIGDMDPEPFQNQPPRSTYEDFVVVYDDDGNQRVEFPRRFALIEYAEQEDPCAK